jgi:DNA-directed RNA polymerase specialized sigma24 family protein
MKRETLETDRQTLRSALLCLRGWATSGAAVSPMAMTALYEAVEAAIGRTLLPPAVIRDEIASEVVLTVLRGVATVDIRDEAACWGWVRTLTARRVADGWRAWRRRRTAEDNYVRSRREGIAYESGASYSYVEQLARHLGPLHLRLLQLRFEGFTYPEIEQIMRVSNGTLCRLWRALIEQVKGLNRE